MAGGKGGTLGGGNGNSLIPARPGTETIPSLVVVSLISLAIGLAARARPPSAGARRRHVILIGAVCRRITLAFRGGHVEPSRLSLAHSAAAFAAHNPDTSAFSWLSPRAP